MSVPRGTTPTFTCTFKEEGLDLTQANNVYVTFKTPDNINVLTKSGDALVINEKTIEVYLTQKDTLGFAEGDVKIQANWTTAGGKRAASEVVVQEISEQLLQKVVE